MSYKSLISLIAAGALLAMAALPPGIAVAKKESGEESAARTACGESTGAFPNAEPEEESGKQRPPGQIGKKPSPGQIGVNNDDDACGLGALPEAEIDLD